MTYATNRPYCDADSHIMETRDWIANFTDPEILSRLPEMSLLKSGTKSFEVINEAVMKQQQRAASGAGTVDVVKGLKGWNAPGAFACGSPPSPQTAQVAPRPRKPTAPRAARPAGPISTGGAPLTVAPVAGTR